MVGENTVYLEVRVVGLPALFSSVSIYQVLVLAGFDSDSSSENPFLLRFTKENSDYLSRI